MNKKVSAGTIARTICLGLALINQLLAVFGVSPIPVEDDTINILIATGATVVAAVANWWKNNSFTQAAIRGDEVMLELKTQR